MKKLMFSRFDLTKERSQDISVVAFKPSKQSKPKRLNAISFRVLPESLVRLGFWLGFWLGRNSLLLNKIYYILTNLTKIYSKTNLGNLYRRTLKTVIPAHTYMLLNIVMSVFWLGWLGLDVTIYTPNI